MVKTKERYCVQLLIFKVNFLKKLLIVTATLLVFRTPPSAVDDVEKEYQRLCDLGVQFSMPPTEAGPVKIAVLDDTCGNNIQLMQEL